MYNVTVYPCILSVSNERIVSFVNFQRPGDKPWGKQQTSKVLQKDWGNVCVHHQFLLSSLSGQ